MRRLGGSFGKWLDSYVHPKEKPSKVLQDLRVLDKNLKSDLSGGKKPWIKTNCAGVVFGIAYILNAAFIGFEVSIRTDEFSWGTWAIESLFLLTFVIEISLRIMAEAARRQIWTFFDAWGIFDASLTFVGIIDTWILTIVINKGKESNLGAVTVFRVFRILRLVNLLKVFRGLGDLLLLLQTIKSAVKAVFWMSLLLGIIMYVGSIFTLLMVGIPYREKFPEVDENFGSLPRALFSHFLVVTLEGWQDIAIVAMKCNGLWGSYFVGMIVILNLLLLNLMVGVIVEKIIHISSMQSLELECFPLVSEQFRQTLQTCFQSADFDPYGEVSMNDIIRLLDEPAVKDVMDAFNINTGLSPATLHVIIGIDLKEKITFNEFFHACCRLVGSKECIHSSFVQHDVCAAHQEIQQELGELQERLQQRLQPEPPQQQEGTDQPNQPEALEVREVQEMQELSRLQGLQELQELRERLARFGQTQQGMQAEIAAMKELALVEGQERSGMPRAGRHKEDRAGAQSQLAQGEGLSSDGTVLHGLGKEIGSCCAGGVLGLQAPDGKPEKLHTPEEPRTRTSDTDSSKELQSKLRKQLTDEFRQKKGRSPFVP